MKERKYLCELVSSFLLDALSLKHNKTNIGLYRVTGSQFLEILAVRIVRKLKGNFESFSDITT